MKPINGLMSCFASLFIVCIISNSVNANSDVSDKKSATDIPTIVATNGEISKQEYAVSFC